MTPRSSPQTVQRGNNESFMLSAQVVHEFQTEAAELTHEGLLSELRLPAASGRRQAGAELGLCWKGR